VTAPDPPPAALTAWAPDGVGEVRPGDDLARVLGDALEAAGGLGLAVVTVTGPGAQPPVTHAPLAQPIGQVVSVKG